MRLMGIRQARLEPLALRAPGHERMANGWAAASGEKRIELSETIAWFGDILARFTVELQARRGLLSFSRGERGEPRLRGRAGAAG